MHALSPCRGVQLFSLDMTLGEFQRYQSIASANSCRAKVEDEGASVTVTLFSTEKDLTMTALASDPSSSTPEQSKSLTAFVSFPSPYTQTLLLQALVSTLPRLAVSLAPFPEDDPPSLQW